MPRKKGSPNKITREIKELLADIIYKESDKIKDALHELNALDKFKYLQIMSKLLIFIIPKAAEEHSITIQEPIKPPSWFSKATPGENSKR